MCRRFDVAGSLPGKYLELPEQAGEENKRGEIYFPPLSEKSTPN